MAENKIILGNSKEKDKSIPIINDRTIHSGTDNLSAGQDFVVYENTWGNDHVIYSILDEEHKADRRLYARALYMQNIECNYIFDDIKLETILLPQPLKFMVVDISMGGVGIICEQELCIGTLLAFTLTLDNIPYDVKYKVVYCFQIDGKYRAGLKIAYNDKQYISHLKILVARLTLQSLYGTRYNNASGIY